MKSKVIQFGTVSQRNWDRSCQNNDLAKFEAEVYTDHTLTRELVVVECKGHQLDTISK
jgi:hypothetical protein